MTCFADTKIKRNVIYSFIYFNTDICNIKQQPSSPCGQIISKAQSTLFSNPERVKGILTVSCKLLSQTSQTRTQVKGEVHLEGFRDLMHV